MSDNDALAAAQERFVSALVSGDELPNGFDTRGARATSAILLSKRRKAIAHAVPVITRALGTTFAAQFDQFARSNPLPINHGAREDAIAFLGWLRRGNSLPADLRLLSLRLRWQRVTRR